MLRIKAQPDRSVVQTLAGMGLFIIACGRNPERLAYSQNPDFFAADADEFSECGPRLTHDSAYPVGVSDRAFCVRSDGGPIGGWPLSGVGNLSASTGSGGSKSIGHFRRSTLVGIHFQLSERPRLQGSRLGFRWEPALVILGRRDVGERQRYPVLNQGSLAFRQTNGYTIA